MKRVKNFSAGPATLPLEVLEEAKAEFLDYADSGMSIIEHSHRGKVYDAVHQETIGLFHELLGLGDEYKVAFFGGGASTQFALTAMNLLTKDKTGDYLVTGSWSQKAVKEAKLFGNAHVAFDPTAGGGAFTKVPTTADCSFSDKPVYVHLTTNNTIAGTQYHAFPECPAPIIADMSSDFLWAPFDPKPFGMIYAGAQKNIGPAGVTVVIIRDDLLEQCNAGVPSMFDYKLQASKQSLYNTPPVFPIYMVGKTLKWIKGNGGLAGIKERNDTKGKLLYDAIASMSDFYTCPVEESSRSMMNVVFRLPTEELEKTFIAEGAENDFMSMKGHRSVGGIRVSIYNAAELAWVEELTSFMKDFAQKHG
jgi:phosphoserine aminotransferase